MKRSEINALIREASACFADNGWALPPAPKWDVTDFGLGDWRRFGLVLVNLAEEPEYCEKLMYAREGMVTPAHCHAKKKEDIIARWGGLRVRVWGAHPGQDAAKAAIVKLDGEEVRLPGGSDIFLNAGERITLVPGVYHEFEPFQGSCIIGEVSTANDDVNDNFFVSSDIGRFPGIEEDEPPLANLVSDR
ncbi:MAG TPA: D-lyxose/D-mannose family sugar isomerase [Fimbriimonadaceae bacterium]|nr:D-lyxose/D-mannose family sugar isomerase [Fimbriimonadaceae bacterium]